MAWIAIHTKIQNTNKSKVRKARKWPYIERLVRRGRQARRSLDDPRSHRVPRRIKWWNLLREGQASKATRLERIFLIIWHLVLSRRESRQLKKVQVLSVYIHSPERQLVSLATLCGDTDYQRSPLEWAMEWPAPRVLRLLSVIQDSANILVGAIQCNDIYVPSGFVNDHQIL